MKRPKPVTSCTDCGTPGYNIGLANLKCGRVFSKKTCKGTNQSAIGDNDWVECPSCEGVGYRGEPQCSQCGGPGWLFARDQRL
jgi:hypothetical protein